LPRNQVTSRYHFLLFSLSNINYCHPTYTITSETLIDDFDADQEHQHVRPQRDRGRSRLRDVVATSFPIPSCQLRACGTI
jgi:hypothetical protein